MDALKIPQPQSGAPKTGLVQFGDELPGIYITAEDAFALRLALAGRAMSADSGNPDVAICQQLSMLLSQNQFGTPAHLKKQREAAPKPLASAA